MSTAAMRTGRDAYVGHLPSPPGDEEAFWYFGEQRRWVPLAVLLSYSSTVVTLFTFALRHPALWMFLVVVALNGTGFVVSALDSLRPRRITRDAHDLLVRLWRPDRTPSVDVFLPTCGEPLEILRNAYRYVSRVHWDGPLRIWVLDDAARDEVAALADWYGFRYVSRPDRGHLKKAGNLNFALARSNGEFIAILDADFCPRPDFLRHMAPYMEAPDLGIVQTPQHFDTHESMGWLERAAGAAQEWFFRWLQPSRDASDAAICCGSNALYRRAAVESAGGFARLDHSEDMFTGLALHRHGYRTRYVPVLVAKGTSPDSLSAFVNQQYRWAMGNLHLVHDREFHRMPASRGLRMSYWNGVVGYLLAAVNVIAAPLPPLIMVFCFASEVRPWHVLPMVAPVWTWLVLLPAVSRTTWRIEVIRAHQLVSFSALVAVLHTARRRSAAWVPTGHSGGRSRLADRVIRGALVWLAATTAGALIGLGWDVVQYGWQQFWGVAAYVAVTSYITVPLIRDLSRAAVR